MFLQNTPEKGVMLDTFFQGACVSLKAVALVQGFIREIERKMEGNIDKWGIVGMCWAGTASSREGAAAE